MRYPVRPDRINTIRNDTSGQTPESPKWSVSMVLAVLFIVTQISPLLGWVGHGLVSSWSVYALWMVAVLIENRRSWRKTREEISNRRIEIAALIGWVLVILVSYMSGRGYTGRQHLMLAVNLSMVVLMELIYTARGDGLSLIHI